MKISGAEMHQQQLLWLVTVLFVTLSFLVPGVPSWTSHPRELATRFALKPNKYLNILARQKSSQGRACSLARIV